jgi:hypothetical protein
MKHQRKNMIPDASEWFHLFLETFIDDPLKARWKYLASRGKWNKMSPDFLWWKNGKGEALSYEYQGRSLDSLWESLPFGNMPKNVLILGIGDSPTGARFIEVRHLRDLESEDLPICSLVVIDPCELAVCFTDDETTRVFQK